MIPSEKLTRQIRGRLAIHSLCWQAFFPFFLTPSPRLPLLHVPLGYKVREYEKKEEIPPPRGFFFCSHFFAPHSTIQTPETGYALKATPALQARYIASQES